VLSNFEIVEDNPEEGRSVVYYQVKAPFGVTNRDFLQQRKVKFDYPKMGMTTMHFRSIEHEKMPLRPKFIRADTIISAYLFEEEVGDKGIVTKLTIVSQNDIKGIIPKTLVNMASGKAPK
jgi:START domain